MAPTGVIWCSVNVVRCLSCGKLVWCGDVMMTDNDYSHNSSTRSPSEPFTSHLSLQWVEVLKLIGQALEENSVPFANLYNHGQLFQVRRHVPYVYMSMFACLFVLPSFPTECVCL